MKAANYLRRKYLVWIKVSVVNNVGSFAINVGQKIYRGN